MTEKLIILGSGPAGLTAALYAARANLNPVCLEGAQPGGQLMITTEVENYPGFTNGSTGPELIEVMRRQAERFGARFLSEEAVGANFSKLPFEVQTDSGVLYSECVIIATGASAKWLGLDSERKLMGHGVSGCATCDGYFFRGKKALVVGGGDTAMEEALFLANLCSQVTIVHRRDQLRASKIMADRARQHDKIDFLWDSVVEEIYSLEEGKVRGVLLKSAKTGETTKVECDGVFVAIGHTPNTAFLNRQLEADAVGYISCKGRSSETSVKGVFACGDAMDPRYRQAVTAAGTGCMAALDAERFLSEKASEAASAKA